MKAEESKLHTLSFGDPNKAQTRIEIDFKPNAVQRYFLRKLLGLYYKEIEL